MKAIFRNVPVKVKRSKPFGRGFIEVPTIQWKRLAKRIGDHLAAGGNVDLDHRRREDADKVARNQPVEVVDVRFY